MSYYDQVYMMLANGINLPLVLIFGVIVFLPLILIEALIESLIFKRLNGLYLYRSFWYIFRANIWSTLAGAVVCLFQGLIIYGLGIRTIPQLYHYFIYGALLLIVIYYLKSVLVEALVLAYGKFAYQTELEKSKIIKSVLIANLASYLLVGPLFYFADRPWFGGIELLDHPSQVTASTETIYFLDKTTDHLYRIQANGENKICLIPHPMHDYIVSHDQKLVVYRSPDHSLYAQLVGDDEPVLIQSAGPKYFFDGVALSPDNQRVAFCEEVPSTGDQNRQSNSSHQWQINIFNLNQKQVEYSTKGSC